MRFCMKVEDVLNLDCRDGGNKSKICDFLLKIKPVQKRVTKNEVPQLGILEKVFQGLCSHYGYTTQGIKPYFEEGEDYRNHFVFYQASMIRKDQVDSGKMLNTWIGYVYGVDMWEMFAKMIIKIYADIKDEERREKNNE